MRNVRPIPVRESVPMLEAAQAAVAIKALVEESFVTHPMRHRTGDEVKRRVLICTKWFYELRTQKRWSVERSLSELSFALNAELDGKTWTPKDSTLWAPNPIATRALLVG